MAPLVLRECRCPEPLPSGNPRRKGVCVRCSGQINPTWTSNDKTVRAFFDHLAEAMFPGKVPHWFKQFRRHCEAREKEGRPKFGNVFLRRDNPVEAMEEAADGALYAMLDVLRHYREQGDHEDYDAALRAAAKFAEAYRELLDLQGKRSGKPGGP